MKLVEIKLNKFRGKNRYWFTVSYYSTGTVTPKVKIFGFSPNYKLAL